MQVVKYRITFTTRNSLLNKLIEERVIEDGITDVNDMNYKFYLVLKAFEKVNTKDFVKKPNCNYYVEVSEICGTEIKRIASATVLSS